MLMRPTPLTHVPLQQSNAYARLLAALGRSGVWVETAAARLLTIRRGPVSYAGRGPVWTSDDPDHRRDFLRAHGPLILNDESTGDRVLRAAGYARLMPGPTHAILPLDGDPLAVAHGKWRNAARQGLRGATVFDLRPFDPVQDLVLLQAARAQERQKGYRGYPPAYTAALAKAAPEAVLTLSATLGQTWIAGMIFLLHDSGATYHLGVTTPQGRKHRAHHAGLVIAARALAAQGARTLDLGVIDPDTAPGLARFKRGTGAQSVALGGTWIRLPHWRKRR